MTTQNFWVIGGEFTSLNFHSFAPGTQIVFGPYTSREDAVEMWKTQSNIYKPFANYRFVISEENLKLS